MRVVVAHNFAAGWPWLIIRYWTVYSEHETAAAAATIQPIINVYVDLSAILMTILDSLMIMTTHLFKFSSVTAAADGKVRHGVGAELKSL